MLFTDAFQYCFDMSFSEYINTLRLKEAVQLLENPSITIDTISERTGFGTIRSFQRQFRAKYNMSPKEFCDMMLAEAKTRNKSEPKHVTTNVHDQIMRCFRLTILLK